MLEALDGHQNAALVWFCFHLEDRTSCIGMGDFKSSLMTLDCVVPQGSILGLLLFSLYLLPVGCILKRKTKHNRGYPTPALQIYIPYIASSLYWTG